MQAQNPQPLHPSDVVDNPAITTETLKDIIEIYPDAPWHPFPWLETLIAISAALVLAYEALRIYRRYKRRKALPHVKTPQELLHETLSGLEKTNIADAPLFYSQVRSVLNAYFHIKWNKPVEALSPEELLVELELEEASVSSGHRPREGEAPGSLADLEGAMTEGNPRGTRAPTKDARIPLQKAIKRYITCIFGGETPTLEERNEDLRQIIEIRRESKGTV